jgi:hypothetical protein
LANKYTRALLNVTNTLETSIYQQPLTVNSVVLFSLYITNTSASSIHIDLTLNNSTGDKIYLCKNLEIPNSEQLVFDKNINFDNANANEIKIKLNDSATSASVILSLIEVS